MEYNISMEELIEKLNDATKAYDEGHPYITDKEWDDMYFALEEMEEQTGIILSNSPTVHVDYFCVNELKKVKHNHPMLSLDKTKSIDEVKKFCKDQRICAMAKMDGLTCSIWYEDGLIVRAETRGNGQVGEDITHNIPVVLGVPLTIPTKDKVVVDGEIICDWNTFKEFNGMFANPRNFAAGSIRLLDNGECRERKLSFVAWDCIEGLDSCETLTEKLFKLDKWGFNFVPHLLLTAKDQNIEHAIVLLKEWAKEFYYPIDGIVFKYDNCAYYNSLGATEHHFRGGLAYKFYDEIYETHLEGIEWSLGRTGVLTPIAILEPVEIDGSIIERASMHNVSIMKKLLPYGLASTGMTVGVYKANMIIPQIAYIKDTPNTMGSNIITHPWVCPICGGKVELVKTNDTENYICANPECEGKLINKLDHFCGKKGLDIKGLSEATLTKLMDWGWLDSISDLFKLKDHLKEWAAKPGFGVKSVDNILTAIENARYCELWQFISALSIPLIGSTYAKEMAKHEPEWFHIREDIEGGYDFTNWDGFGPEMDASLHNFDYKEADDLVFNKVVILKNSYYKINTGNEELPLNGKVFCITGRLETFKNRNEAKDKIESLGGKVTDSVTKNTSYLVNNDVNSTSSKNLSAKKLNIPIITESELTALFGNV